MADQTQYHGQDHDTLSYFGECAAGYDQYRPRYPEVALQWIVESFDRPVVVDIGSGTGIASRQLAEISAQVIGIEPNADMREVARGQTAKDNVAFQAGRAEQTNLADGFADVVVCAQAFHWFDAPRALREFNRILKPNGRVALMWNVRDPDDAMSRGYNDVMDRAMQAAHEAGRTTGFRYAGDPTVGGFFMKHEHRAFANPVPYTLEQLLGRAASASYMPKAGPLRDELFDELRRLFAAESTDGTVIMEHRCEVSRAMRVADMS